MDAFYAQVEMRDNPNLKNVPLVLAKDPRLTNGHGVVATANYLARELGIHSAMSANEAKKLAPHAIFLTPNFAKYQKVSQQVHDIFQHYTDMIEPIAFDEAYLDVTNNKLDIVNEVNLARRLQDEIWQQLALTCSLGISYNKFIAKLASEYNKPVGTVIIHPNDAIEFLQQLPIEDFRGVGKKTLLSMYQEKIYTGTDLYHKQLGWLTNKFGRLGYELYQHVRGIDERPVMWQRERKSIGKELTFTLAITSQQRANDVLNQLVTKLVYLLKQCEKHGRTIVMKIRYHDFETVTKRVTKPDFYKLDETIILAEVLILFNELGGLKKPIRLLGITFTNLAPISFENINLPLFD